MRHFFFRHAGMDEWMKAVAVFRERKMRFSFSMIRYNRKKVYFCSD